MSKREAFRVFLLLSMFFCTFFASPVFAQTASTTTATTTIDKEAELQQQLSDVNEEIAGLNNSIGGLQQEGAGLDRDIKLLTANINKANLNIKAKNIMLAQLAANISSKKDTVTKLQQKIVQEKASLAQLIRKTNEIDQSNLLEVLLSNQNLSDFFMDLDSFDSIRAGLKDSSLALNNAKSDTVTAEQALEEKQNAELDAKSELERNKQIVLSDQAQKQNLLSITKNKQKEYQKVLVDRQKTAAQIRAALFALRDSGEINFGKALDYANIVSAKTGIRPAFLLAVFQQESSFGKNQGSCYLKNSLTGGGISTKTGNPVARVMKPDRDVTPFLRITQNLAHDPYNTLVSCPQEVGWGGAMGAAQFIPSTWVLYADRIKNALNEEIADPWSARDAFMAAGLYLSDIGASAGTYSAERDAACKYFSGSKCSRSRFAATYGNQVMSKASTIQTTMIDPLQNT